MGIRGLNTCITRTCPNSIKAVRWADYENSVIGIDITCFLYRAIASQLDPIDVICAQIVNFKKLKIRPIYVFDGKAPQEKDIVVTKRKSDRIEALDLCLRLKESLLAETDESVLSEIRRQICEIEGRNPVLTYEAKDEIKKFLYITGTAFVTASGEADSLLAYMFKRRTIDAVISLDLDFIARGALLLVPKTINSEPGSSWSVYDPVVIRRQLRLSEERFIDMCVLIGSDYTPDMTIVPWKTALKSLLGNETISEIWSRHTFCNWRKTDSNVGLVKDINRLNKAKEILLGLNDTADTLLDADQWAKCFANSPIEPDGIELLKKKYQYWNAECWDTLISAN